MLVHHAKQWVRRATDARYRELDRLYRLPAGVGGRTDVLGRPMRFVDGRSFFLQHRVIVEQELYALATDSPTPTMIDAGANIGMAVVDFKRRFPAGRVVAIEADPEIAKVLEENVAGFGLDDVTVLNGAVTVGTEPVTFFMNPLVSEGGRLSQPTEGHTRKVVVRPVDLRDLLQEPVDFLKVDIEGAETEVMLHCEDRLDRVRRLFVEYHSFESEPQTLPELLALLKRTGFRIAVQTDYCPPQPLRESVASGAMDLRLNLFGVRR